MIDSLKIYSAACKTVKRYHTRNPFEIAEISGIRLIYSSDLGRIQGLYKYMLKNRVIILNSRLDSVQKEIVLAHELGHDRLHSSLAKSGLADFNLFDFSAETEYEANAFAAHLLIDDSILNEYVNIYAYNIFQMSEALKLSTDLISIKIKEMNKLGQSFSLPFEPDSKFLKNTQADSR